MTIEETLASIDTTLRAILTTLSSGAAAITTMGEPEVKATKTKAAKDTTTAAAKPTSEKAGAVLDGDPEGTRYWMSHDNQDFYKTEPGADKPPVDNVNNVSAAYFASHKNELAKKSNAAAAVKSTAAAEPTATAQPANVSNNSDVTFKQVVDRLTALSKDTKPGRGREGVMAILNKHLADLPENERKVPKLETLKKNAELLADVDAALLDAPADNDDPFA